jgi:threonine synthase
MRDAFAGTEARPDFRCSLCGDLFEVEYPGWGQRKGTTGPTRAR